MFPTDFETNWPDVRIGDVFYVLGHQNPQPADWAKVKDTRWYNKRVKRFSFPWPEKELGDVYNAFTRQHGHEPNWVQRLPTGLRRHLRIEWLRSEYFDPLEFHFSFARDLGYICAIKSDGLVHKLSYTLGMYPRSHYVKQLGFLHDPVINEAVADSGLGMHFNHTRYAHCGRVMPSALLMGRQVGLSPREMLHLLASSYSHDTLTPAGGDSVKPISPAAFDEDIHYPEIFRNNPEWDALREQYKFDEELLASIVRGEGLLGKLLDLADKTTYVAHDLEAYLMGQNPRRYRHISAPESILQVWDLHQRLGPGCCKLWDILAAQKGELVVTDARRFFGFVLLRALMFRHLYYNPLARYREHMLAMLILDPLYHEGRITREMLLKMTDWDLENWLNRMTRSEWRMELCQTRNGPKIEAYPTREVALGRMRALATERPELLFMLDVIPPSSEKLMQYLVRDQHNHARPFCEAYPDEAAEVRRVGHDPLPAKLYVLTPDQTMGFMPLDIRESVYRRQRERFELGPIGSL